MKVQIKIIIITLLTFFSFYNSEAQILDKLQQFISKEVNYKEVSVKNTGEIPIFYYRGELFTGTIIHPWDRLFIKNGKMAGFNKIYEDNGNLVLETTFVDGIKEGSFIEYFKILGIPKVRKGRYVRGEYDGLIIQYDSDGTIDSKTNYKNGILDGPDIHYDSDGKISSKDNYTNGALNGYHESWVLGKIAFKGNYLNDKKVGTWIELRLDSNVKYHDEENYYEVEYVNGREISSRKISNIQSNSGFVTTAKSDHKESSIVSNNGYDINGYKHGQWIEYIFGIGDGNEEVPKDKADHIRHITYNHGMPVGMVKDYYPNGNIQSEFELTSGPYKRNQHRPADQYAGYYADFDEDTSKIWRIVFYNDDGTENPAKTKTIGLERAKKDPRFDKDFFIKTEFGREILQ